MGVGKGDPKFGFKCLSNHRLTPERHMYKRYSKELSRNSTCKNVKAEQESLEFDLTKLNGLKESLHWKKRRCHRTKRLVSNVRVK